MRMVDAEWLKTKYNGTIQGEHNTIERAPASLHARACEAEGLDPCAHARVGWEKVRLPQW